MTQHALVRGAAQSVRQNDSQIDIFRDSFGKAVRFGNRSAATQQELCFVALVHDRLSEAREHLGDKEVLFYLSRRHASRMLSEKSVDQFGLRLRQPLHEYSITRGPKAILRLTRAPDTAIRSPAGTCIVRPSM
jgi:hypothetical protein